MTEQTQQLQQLQQVLEPTQVVDEEQLLKDLPGIDATRVRPQSKAAFAPVPGWAVELDPEQVELVGEGLPVIHGVGADLCTNALHRPEVLTWLWQTVLYYCLSWCD